jgi:hypothetical protein
MSTRLEYHERVRHLTSASIARCRRVSLPLRFFSFPSSRFNFVPFFVALIFACTSFTASGFAQNGGGSGGGGHAGGGGSAGASFSGSHVASGSVGFGFSGSHGSGSGANGSGSNHSSHANPTSISNGNHPHHHYQGGGYAGPVLYAVPFPYIEDDSAANDDSADADAETNDNDADYQGGPTIFDRRGSGADSYIPPVDVDQQSNAAMHAEADQAPQRPTVLVFKDGHQIEVGNYAIVGVTLFDLTPGHARRVALADLDLEATQKQNDDRGVMFALPASTQAN